jgi:hypothetical protein
MRQLLSVFTAVAISGLGCASAQGTGGAKKANTPSSSKDQPQLSSSQKSSPAGPKLTPADQVPKERRVWAYVDGTRRSIDLDEARSLGLTLVDLSDDWVPYIFWDQSPGKDDHKPNAYMHNYVELANDRINVDGAKLSSRQHNYHEVFGIPPTLSVLKRRFLRDEEQECFGKLNYELFKDYHGPVRVVDPGSSRRELKRYRKARDAFKKALRKSGAKDLEALEEKSAYKKIAKKYRRYHWRHLAIEEMKKRMVCEGMYARRPRKASVGHINWGIRGALKQFERKHNIYGWGMIFQNTAEALGRSARENNYQSLRRLIIERTLSAAGILEDGSSKATWKDEAGKKHKLRNLVKEFGEAAVAHMGLDDAEKGLAFIKGHQADDFKRFIIALPLPKTPAYYSSHMDLSVEVDRGDVFYDLPFNEKGKRISQRRERLPKATVFLTYQKQRIPLVSWRTTIGGWNAEMRNGQEYYKYKMSDVGPRVWKHVVAGPVWVPPPNTPPSDLVKYRSVAGKSQRVVGQSTFGPGYASAYGLVAAFHVTKRGRDNGIRMHGSVNYMSILRRAFSHGCHRLLNFQAVRLFSFVLRHRNFERKGQSKLAYNHRFEHRGEEFHISLHTRGYYYELTPPLPVNVLEGRLKGKLKEPTKEYVKKPSVVYQEDLNKGQTTPRKATGAPRTGEQTPASPMTQKQTL